MRLWLATLLVSAVAGAQDAKPAAEKKPKEKTAGEIEIPAPGVTIQDAGAARQQVVRFQTEAKQARKDDHKLVELLRKLGEWDHAMVLKEAKRYVRHKSHIVAIEAVVVCARQTSDKNAVGKYLLGQLKREKRNHVRCALLVGMGVVGYDASAARKEAVSYFRKDLQETHKAATRYLGYIKDKESFRMIAEKLDRPQPGNVNDPNNPPASYWKEQHDRWESNRPATKWALSQIVPGEKFDATREAKDWAESEGSKHGIKW